jgi:hypothetical protein
VKLPAELAPPLQAQRFCLKARLCAGVGCPPQDVISLLAPAVPLGRNQKAGPPIPIPTRHLDCFCVSLYAIGRFAIETIAGKKRLRAHIDGVDIVEIKPDGLEEALVCYLRLVLELVLLPRLAFPVEAFVFHTLKGMPSIALSPTPTPGGVPNNPAVEKDRLEAFVDVTVTP